MSYMPLAITISPLLSSPPFYYPNTIIQPKRTINTYPKVAMSYLGKENGPSKRNKSESRQSQASEHQPPYPTTPNTEHSDSVDSSRSLSNWTTRPDHLVRANCCPATFGGAIFKSSLWQLNARHSNLFNGHYNLRPTSIGRNIAVYAEDDQVNSSPSSKHVVAESIKSYLTFSTTVSFFWRHLDLETEDNPDLLMHATRPIYTFPSATMTVKDDGLNGD
ncbi:hypothetical protein BDD12DRAFT_890095 [Trichophaea hybrida]|nr:hypothetical protein BDD12DRAFT_890095 [Trichophaea hybrida]